jgi:pyruvate,water dikinase
MLDPVVRRSIYDISEKQYSKVFRLYRLYIGVRFTFLSLIFPILRREFDKKSSVLFSSGGTANLSKMANAELIHWFNVLEDRFLSVWAIPIINDFRLMVSYGILVQVARSWVSDSTEIVRYLSIQKTAPISVIILRDSQYIAEKIRNSPSLSRLFKTTNSTEIYRKLSLPRYREVQQLIQKYLEQYGDRMANELKLEEPSFREYPIRYIDLLKQHVMSQHISYKAHPPFLSSSLTWWKRLFLRVLCNFVSDAMHQREFFRLRRLQAFRIAKNVYLEFADRLVTSKKLRHTHDIFYLTHDEIVEYIYNPTKVGTFISLVHKRKHMQKIYSDHPLPQLVLTDLNGNVVTQKNMPKAKSENIQLLSGKPASEGMREGDVVVMESLDTSIDISGKILVTKTTDPGWTILFPLLSGVITQYGGVLSHAAIIARELEIPCIVGASGVTENLVTGERISMNGTTGEIRRIQRV